MPYCFLRSYVKFQGQTALKIVELDPNWVFPDCNSSLNSPMAMKCCTKLERAKERCPIVFQGHPSNFKVTRDKTSPILTQIGRFRTIGRSQLSNPSDLPCFVCISLLFSFIVSCQIVIYLELPRIWIPVIYFFLTNSHWIWSLPATQTGYKVYLKFMWECIRHEYCAKEWMIYFCNKNIMNIHYLVLYHWFCNDPYSYRSLGIGM